MKVVIPMSGVGQRFVDAGYKYPKPLIEVDNKPIIEYVVNMFDTQEDEFIFICNATHLKETHMREVLPNIVKKFKIIEIKPHKLGPVHAVLQAKEYIENDESVVVNYCDFNVNWNYEDFKNKMISTNCTGCVPSYYGFHPHLLDDSTLYGGVKIDENNFMIDYKEKHCFEENIMDGWHSAGTYYFKTGEILKKYFQKVVDKDINYNGEYYASIPYYLMLEDNLPIYVYELKHFMQWGTPKDLEEYLEWSKLFKDISENKINEKEIQFDEPMKRNSFHYWKEYFNESKDHPYKNEIFDISFIEEVAIEAGAIEAGKIAMKEQETAEAEEKDEIINSTESNYLAEKQAFSEIDIRIQNIILEKIGSLHPKRLNVVIEEQDSKSKKLIKKYFLQENKIKEEGYTLVIDPIDGSANYLSKNPKNKNFQKRNENFWAISICILKDKQPLIGAFYYPALDTLVLTEKNKGTFVNGEKVKIKQNQIFDEHSKIRVSSSIPNYEEYRNKFTQSTHTGSLSTTFLALLNSLVENPFNEELPQCNAYIGGNTVAVDLGCGTLAIEEAGGVVVDFELNQINPYEDTHINEHELKLSKNFLIGANKEYIKDMLK